MRAEFKIERGKSDLVNGTIVGEFTIYPERALPGEALREVFAEEVAKALESAFGAPSMSKNASVEASSTCRQVFNGDAPIPYALTEKALAETAMPSFDGEDMMPVEGCGE